MSTTKRRAKYLLAFVAAAILALAMAVPAYADALPSGTKGADKTITIKPPQGVDTEASNTYTVYKVFNATTDGTNISYKSLDGTAPTGFVVDNAQNVYLGTATDTATGAAGEIAIQVGQATKYIVPSTAENLTDEQISAIASYTGKVSVGTVTITGSTETTVTVPDYGYYYITTTTGTVVTIDSTHKSASVEDKNTVPTVKKEITDADSIWKNTDNLGKKALEQIGKTVEYKAYVTVGKGSKNYVFHDVMGSGLAFTGNDNVVVTIDDPTKLPTTNPATTESNFYTIKSTPDSPDTLTVTFVDGIAEGAVITVKYYGKVTSDALTVDTGKNTCYVSYGDENSNNKTPEDSANVYNAKLDVTKTDGENKALAGAGFVVKNSAGAYYKFTPAVAANAEANPPVAAADATVSWYTLASGETLASAIEAGKITEYTTTSETGGNIVSFTGLSNGTYTLVESTVPDGYNKAADKQFTIAGADQNLTEAASGTAGSSANVAEKVVNNKGAELPSTGGIGTTILYIIGGILVLGAVVFLITKRRMAKVNIESDDTI